MRTSAAWVRSMGGQLTRRRHCGYRCLAWGRGFSTARTDSADDSDSTDALNPSEWRKLLKVFFLRTHPDTMHGLPEHAQLANAESYKVLNDFIDTASIFVEPARAASTSTKMTPAASDSNGSSLPTVSQAKYDMEFYVKLATAGVAAPHSESESSHQGGGSGLINDCEDQLDTQIVNLTLKVPKQHRTMQQGQNALAAAEVWHDLVRSCLRSLVGTVATPQNPLPKWIMKTDRKRSQAKAQNHLLTRKQVEQKLRKAFAEDGAFVGAAEDRAREAVLDFDLGAFPEGIQQFVLRHFVFESGHTLLTTRRHHLNEIEAKAIPRLALAILRHADELGLSTSLSPEDTRASDGLAVVISSRHAVAQEAAAAAAAAAANQETQKSGQQKWRRREKVRLFGPDGVRLRSKRSGEVVVAADAFEEVAFVDNLIRAKENLGLFEAEEGPLH